MKIVKPTNPPSMAIIVDTIMYGDVILVVPPCPESTCRHDLVYVRGATVGMVIGPNPQPAPDMRVIAVVHVCPGQNAILHKHIREYL